MSLNHAARKGIKPLQKHFFIKKIRPFEERMRQHLEAHKLKKLVLSRRAEDKPMQYQVPQLPPQPRVVTNERKLPSLVESASPYTQYSQEFRNKTETFGTYYDPLFNPHLPDERHKVDPNEEPFNAIYTDSQSESAQDYTKVRTITTPELWASVELLARKRVAPMPKLRKPHEPIVPLPSGYVPPPETPPDLPYHIARTRNHLLPVYYHLDKDPNNCVTIVKQVTGDLWKLEEDLRAHLESLQPKRPRILSSVMEPDELIQFRGKYLHEVADWLHAKGF